MLALLATLLTGFPAAAADEPPAKLELFAKEGWYKSQEGKEQDFVGILHKIERKKGVIGFGRFNPYYLVMEAAGKKSQREVYIGGKPAILAPYVGKKIKLSGKPVDLEVEGRNHREIWPARLVVLAPPKKNGDGPKSIIIQLEEKLPVQGDPALAQEKGQKELKIIAKAFWRYASPSPDGPKKGLQLVLRSAAELVAATPFSRLDAPQQVVEKMATAELAKALKVDTIDWKTRMLVVVTAGVKPTGGYSVDILSVKVADKTATVTWKLNTPKGFVTQAFTHPGQVALVERFDGEVKFVAGPAGPPKRKEKLDPDVPVPDPKADPPGLKVLALASGRGALGSRVVRTAGEAMKAFGTKDEDAANALLAKMLKVEKIDWQKHMLILISGGVQRSGGYSVQVNKLAIADKTLTVHWKLNRPKPGQPVTLALTHPGLMVLADRFDGEVRFDPAPPKGGKGLPDRR